MTKFIRKPNRLPFKNLYQGGRWYFVTICVLERKCVFGKIQNREIFLNSAGKIVENKIISLSNFYDLTLDEFVIMPNHIHLIIGNNKKPLSTIIGGLKSFALKEIKTLVQEGSCLPKSATNKISLPNEENGDHEASTTVKYLIKTYGTIWQKSFYDHIIRDEKDKQRIQEYIYNNSFKWEIDILNLINRNKFEQWTKKCKIEF